MIISIINNKQSKHLTEQTSKVSNSLAFTSYFTLKGTPAKLIVTACTKYKSNVTDRHMHITATVQTSSETARTAETA